MVLRYRRLVTHDVVLGRSEVVLMAMEAGIEHLGRAKAKAMDKLIVFKNLKGNAVNG